MATLRDLVTVGYRPRETMRRILDDRDRWAVQIVILAYVCASVQDPDAVNLGRVLPGLGWTALAVVALGLVVGGAAWVVLLFILAWIATFAGRKLGGIASAADVRAALAWGMVPVVWSPIYRIPFAVLESRVHLAPGPSPRIHILDVLGQGGCSIVVVYLAFQLVFMAWCLFVGSNCVAEAQQFSSARGFANVAIAIAAPIVVIAAAVVTSTFAT